jgi:hypothetical protein
VFAVAVATNEDLPKTAWIVKNKSILFKIIPVENFCR